MSVTPAQSANFSSANSTKARRIAELRIHACKKRSSGSVTIDRRPSGGAIGSLTTVNEYVSSLGFQDIGKRWVQLPPKEARSLMRLALQRNLSSKASVMGPWTAKRIAKRFLSQFEGRSVQFYTNVEYHSGNIHVWQPISKSPFDMGVVAFDRHSIGILWVEDKY